LNAASAILRILQGNRVQETANSARVFRFGVFEVDAATGELRKQGLRIRLQEQPYQLLLMLLDRAGEVVSREEIRCKLWPPDTFVDFDSSLNTALRKLRQALCDSADNPRFIETLARRGYRFIAPVHAPTALQPARSPGPETGERQVPIHKQFWVVLAAVLVLVVVAGILYKLTFEQGRTASDALPPPVPLTSYSGFQWSPSFSPDGTRVAFTWDEPGKRAPGIYVKLIGPTDPVRLTPGEESDFAPVWSPDGRWIAFLRANGPFRTVVMLIPSLGGPARELARLRLHTPPTFLPRMVGREPSFSSMVFGWEMAANTRAERFRTTYSGNTLANRADFG
jgi:DNA-binding winged helix-turn-helix (wHTH) protein